MRKRKDNGSFGGAEPNSSDEENGSETEKEDDEDFFK